MLLRSLRPIAPALVAALTLGTLACSDAATDPTPTSLKATGPHLTIASSSTTTATLYPTVDNVYQSVEGHRLVIPANSICNPSTTAYGSAYWNAPCQPATSPITFTITTTVNASGYSKVTVQPDVRFVPAKTVMVFFKDSAAAAKPGMVIKYCTLLTCVDEGTSDPALVTYRDATQGYIYRRLKHFSGYNVTFGGTCTPGVDPGCGDDPGATSKAAPMSPSLYSGYISTIGALDAGR